MRSFRKFIPLWLVATVLFVFTACTEGSAPPTAWAELPTNPSNTAVIPTPPPYGGNPNTSNPSTSSSYTEETPAVIGESNEANEVNEAHEPTEDYLLCETQLEGFPFPFPFQPPGLDLNRPMIALTFDDGPVGYTNYILELLKKHGGRATFFVIGNMVEAGADIVRRTIEYGSEVAGHSWNHDNLTMINAAAVTQQITDTSAIIEAVTGSPPPTFFRAPFGMIDDTVTAVSKQLGYSIVRWSIDTQDWRYRDADHVYNYVSSRAANGAIVLMHDIHASTKEAMHRLIPRLIQDGFQLVTVSEIIEHFYGYLEPGKEYRGLR